MVCLQDWKICNVSAWFASAFVFGKLLTMVSSDSYSQWLTSLTLYPYSEIKIQHFNSPKERSLLLNWLHSNRSDSSIVRDLNETGIEYPDVVSKLLLSSEEILSTNGATPRHQHYFHMKFLSLSENVMEIVAHIFKDTVSFHSFEQLSNRLLKQACECDLLAMSFADVDCISRMLVSSHSLSCSALAFNIGLSLFFNNSQKLESDFYVILIHDLMGRIWCIDRETCKELMLLLETSFGQSKTRCLPQSKTLENTYEVGSIIKICLNTAKRICDNYDGLQFSVKNMLNVSLGTPKYFFNVRPRVSCELFAMNRESGNGGRISVPPGCHLHLDLCLQLCDMPSEFRAKLTKLYCILQCKMLPELADQSGGNKSQTDMQVENWVDDNVLELNEKIVKYVTNGDKIRSNGKDCGFNRRVAEMIVCLRVNGEGQGFGSCMLHVSRFSLGCYEITWRAGCVDVDGSYWSLNSLNFGPVFTVQKSC